MLFYFMGTKVFEFQSRFAELYGRKHCIACSSGTAAVHIAVGALELPPGSEVVTSAITDMGSLTGLLYQGLAPVFADVDPDTLNMDPASVRARITARTRAILVVHHSGLAADMDAMLDIGREFGLPLIEDCAQAYCCEYNGKLAGNMGVIGAYSLNHFKHITCGSGGMVTTDDDRLRYIASLFLDKCYQREEGIRNPFFLAPNYQMTELQGAVAQVQLGRIDDLLADMRRRRQEIEQGISDVARSKGVEFRRKNDPEGDASIALIMFAPTAERANYIASALDAEGVESFVLYRPDEVDYHVYAHWNSILNQRTWSANGGPWRWHDGPVEYSVDMCPRTLDLTSRAVHLNVSPDLTDQTVAEIIAAVNKVLEAAL